MQPPTWIAASFSLPAASFARATGSFHVLIDLTRQQDVILCWPRFWLITLVWLIQLNFVFLPAN